MIMETKTEETKKKRGRPKKSDAEGSQAKKAKQKSKKVDTDAKNVAQEQENLPERKRVGNNGNLIPFNQRTMEERREIGSRAGKASVESRRRKKELREFTRDFLMQEAVPALKGNMKTLGVEAEEMTNLSAMVVRLFSKAVNTGDLNAARTIIEWAGMAPLQEVRENEAIARLGQAIQLASGDVSENVDEDETVVFYIPQNGRPIITDDDLVTVGEDA